MTRTELFAVPEIQNHGQNVFRSNIFFISPCYFNQLHATPKVMF